jgi:hypothetical protein
MAIDKSVGQTWTEQYLSHLCDRTFLKLWSYANPFKSDGKELCDLIAVFENNIFLFFDRESRTFDRGGMYFSPGKGGRRKRSLSKSTPRLAQNDTF